MKKISWLHFLKQQYYAYLFKNGKFKYTEMLEVKLLKKIHHADINRKRKDIPTRAWNTLEFKARSINRNKEGYFKMIKALILQRDKII